MKKPYLGEHECVYDTHYFYIVVNGAKKKIPITECRVCGKLKKEVPKLSP